MQYDKTVTKYFDISCNVIIHWYGKAQEERVFKEKGDNENNGGLMREERE